MLLLLMACNNGPMTVVTYNAGLAEGFVPGTLDRAQKTADAVAAVEADVICLQEVWQPAHAELYTAGWEQSFVPEAQQVLGEGAACTEDDLSALNTCIDTQCAEACTDELVDCVFDGCAIEFLGIPQTCQSCVMANVGGDVDKVNEVCLQEATTYAYDGSFGTAILSAHPILSTEEHVFSSTTNRRSVLHAVIDGPLGETDVYCTHLTAIFDLIPYTGEAESWDAEQVQQIADLRSFVDETATGPVVLLGDFNNGPDQHINNYNELSQGFVSPYVRDDGDCTYCADNPLNSEDSADRVIDHVLLRDIDLDTTSERVLDEALEIEVCGEVQDGAYSDHYGVRVTLGG
jgi:endonuclease/exonuclease/phosphatase family metal-dependent hydrolase